ncbi:hypothetical protein BG015_004843 [Linnemannia schmuckeri]|uniref:Uncharacterized protein n=1 Tax=Linnemannia schmuckeri TaxID=64567 RepID=A0A9P5S1T5_9FUNG|nr:hypothetical protein BG015_004843 [Linnemannia schmuckeri]
MIFIIVGFDAGLIGAIAALFVITVIIGALGLGVMSITAGTAAAEIMASYGGAVDSGSACATLQSGAAALGAAGIALVAVVGGATAGAAAIGAVGKCRDCSRIKK